MLIKTKIHYFMIGLFLCTNLVVAQTSSWKLEWDQNTESDMLHYEIYRGTSPNPTSSIATVAHPTTVYQDEDIDPGVRYYYRLKAVNDSYQKSEFSDQVSAAIPGIVNFPSALQFDEGSNTQITLDDYVNDPDHEDSQLTWQVGSAQNLSVQINASTRVAIISANQGWTGSETLSFTVTDSDGFEDYASVIITVGEVGQSNGPLITNFPRSLQFNEGANTQIELDDYVNDPDHDDSQLTWQVSSAQNLIVQINASTRIASISANPGWTGSETLTFTVSDPDGGEDVASVIITVGEVSQSNAPLISDFPNIDFNEDESTQIFLNDFVTDTDTPVENLYWSMTGNDNIIVQIDHNTNIAIFSANQDWNGAEDLTINVKDPDQNEDDATFSVSVQAINDRPVMVSIPSVNLSVQKSSEIDLKDYTTDVDHSMAQLEWTAWGNQNVNVVFSGSGLASLSVSNNWKGTEEFYIYVSDPSGGRDTSSINVYSQDQQSAPEITNLNSVMMDEDTYYEIDLTQHVTDPDNTPAEMTWTFDENPHVQLTIDQNTDLLQLTPNSNWFGTTSVAVKVSDPDKNVDYADIDVTVNPLNDAPVLNQINTVVLYSSSFNTIDLKDYIIEHDGFDDITGIDVLGPNNSLVGTFVDYNNLQVTFFAPGGYSGQETYMLKIRDSHSLEASSVFTVEVITRSLASSVDVDYFGSTTNVQLSWETTHPSVDYVEYGKTQNYEFTTQQDEDFSSEHRSLINGLEPNTAYHFRIVSQNANGKIIYSPDSTFTTGIMTEEVNVFPIPFRSNDPQHGEGIFFSNLPENSAITVYNILGEIVFRQDRIDDHIFRWNVRNNAGKEIRSGLYLFVIKDGDNSKQHSGKLVVVR